MKRLIIFILATVAIVVVLDVVCGKAMKSYTQTHTLPGDCAAIDYTIKQADEELIILGNSHVLNSLMPSILSDSLGMSVYNGASNGQTLPFFHSMLECILARHTPKAIILGIDDGIFSSSGPGERYNILAPYYGMGYAMIDSCLADGSMTQKLMINSTFYRFNSIWWRILLYHIVKDKEHSADGFIAKPVPAQAPKRHLIDQDGEINPQRMEEFRAMLQKCSDKGIKVAVFMTPQYYEDRTQHTIRKALQTEIAHFDNATLIDDSSDSLFMASPRLFFDNTHLNAEGAEIYSRMAAPRLKKFLLGEVLSDKKQ